MDPPPIQYVQTSDGVSIAYWRLGAGPVVVQLPSLPYTHVRLEWEIPAQRRLFEMASADVTFVRYDGRGTGLSEREAEEFSLETMLLDLDAVVKDIGAERVTLNAAFYASSVAIAYAARHPERVSHLVLWAPVVDGSGGENSEQLRGLGRLIETNWDLFVQTAAHALVGWQEAEEARQFAEVIREGVTQSTLQRLLPVLVGLDVRDDLARLTCPTLILHRPAMPLAAPGSVERVAASIPSAQLMLFEGRSVSPVVGDWRAPVRAIYDFMGLRPSGKSRSPGGRALRLLNMKADSLTPREREVVGLVVRGLTNREISEELFLAEKTVENHVGRILVKLDLRSRTELAAYAVEHGLAGRSA